MRIQLRKSKNFYEMLQIKGLQKTSLVDYPGKIVCTIFLAGCNFRCPYCQNPDLIDNPDKLPAIKEEEIIDFLEKKRKWLDGICISGGEPTLHDGLVDFIKKVKKENFLVKIDTNGTNPKMIKELIDNKLINFISMDIKASLDKYSDIANVEVNKEDIQKSVELIMNGDINYEFRSTILPKLHSGEDIKKMGEWLKGSKKFVLQQFRPKICLDKKYEDEKAFTREEMEKFRKLLEPYFDEVELRFS